MSTPGPDHGILQQRLRNQKLVRSNYRKPADIVAWLGAVQAQDYAAARWGVGQRGVALTDAAVERAFDQGTILRTHVLRPTWHFVVPADIRWLLTATAPRVHALSAYYRRQEGLDAATFARSHKVLERALRDGHHLTRAELAAALQRAGIEASGPRLGHIMMHAELEQLVCSGPRRGKQFTYALLAERAPHARQLRRDDALAALAARFFPSHGPATLRDYAWWSGLGVREARLGLEAIAPKLTRQVVSGHIYWFPSATALKREPAPTAHLLPNYDEYLIAYKDRDLLSAVARRAKAEVLGGRRRGDPERTVDPFSHQVILDGRPIGSWTRTMTTSTVGIEVACDERPPAAQARAIASAAADYARFLRSELTLEITP